MKLGFIAHGTLPIPPKGWGAVEGNLWQAKRYLERLGHAVEIANTPAIYDLIHYANQRRYDFVHCHRESFVSPCLTYLKCGPFAVTSHDACLHQFDPDAPDRDGGFQYLFQDMLNAPANIVLSERIRDLYLRSGYRHFLRVLRNAVETEEFRAGAQGNGRAVCLGLICDRKRQGWLADAARQRVPVDFIGPWNREKETGFVEDETMRYLGEWDRSTLYAHLTDYSCLVLLSAAEAAPKVVLEAFAAGLSVVISDACRANLTDEGFITVIPDGETRPDVIAHAIQTAIDRNPSQREAIRQYALDRFDYTVVMREYLRIIDEYRDLCASARTADGGRLAAPRGPAA